MYTTGKKRDPLAEYVGSNKIDVKDAEQFRNVLYDHVVDTIDNRISTQLAGVSNEHLHQYAVDLLLETSRRPNRANQSEKCVLEVRVQRGESLAPKDVAGTSDPYCVVGIAPQDVYANLMSKKTATKYLTSIKTKTLSPEWNECLEVPVSREQIASYNFHAQIWDRDDEESVASALGAIKDVKGIRGIGRFVKDVAETVGKKDNSDDFMGFSSIPLRNIPMDGLEKWFSLRARGPLENISGRVRIGLKLTCPHILVGDSDRPGHSVTMVNGGRIGNQPSDEEIYGGLLTLMVNRRHNTYKDLKSADQKSKPDGWDGKLQKVDETLMREFELQRKVDKFACAVARWEIYCAEHTQMSDGVEMRYMSDLLRALEAANDGTGKQLFRPLNPIAGPGEKATIFTREKLPRSFDKFLRHCHQKIEDHQTIYPAKQNDTMIRLGELLMCLKVLLESKLYLAAKRENTFVFGSGNVDKDISQSLGRGIESFYWKACDEHQALKPNVFVSDEGNPVEDYDVGAITKLVNKARSAMADGQFYFHPVFKEVLRVDYMSVVLEIVSKNLERDLKEILHRVNKTLSEDPDPVGEESANKSTAMFQLYMSLSSFDTFMCGAKGDGSPHGKFDDLSLQPRVGSLKDFHEWFRPTILRWLQMSRGRAIQRLTAAVKVEKVARIDDIAKHSSSSVDAISCLSSVVTFWHQIKWPDMLDGFLIATRIIEDISNGAELYADLVHDKLKMVGFFDNEGQFDVTEELCLALNNLEKVRLFLANILRDMDIENLARKMDRTEEGPSGEQMRQSFQTLMRNADEAMRRKIREVTLVVGRKMQPDIQRYFSDFVVRVMKISPKKQDDNPLNGHDSDYDLNRQQWESIAEDAVGPLMKYLTSNLRTLKEWLCDSNFRILLDVLWKVSLRSMMEVLLKNYSTLKPYIFKLCRYVLKESFTVFFHAEGEGLELEKMFAAEEYAIAEIELKMRGASSQDLMRVFFSQMYDDQQALKSSPYGTLNVYSWYDTASSEIKVEVISAENLVPRDMNGLSDPFVQINLMPRAAFPSHSQKQTLEKKNTLNPLFDGETFSFEVDRALVVQEGIVIVFTVLDYDVIGRNELEGECVLPMKILDGIQEKTSSERGIRTFKLALTQPRVEKKEQPNSNEVTEDGPSVGGARNWSSPTPLGLLRQRISFDRDASEFSRWRKRLEDSTEDDDTKGPNRFLKSLLK